MPIGMADPFTHQEFLDLVRFLSELGKPGPYAIHATPTFQRWKVLKPVPSGLSKSVPDPDAFRDQILGAEPGHWTPAYASVPGSLDLQEVSQEVGNPVVFIRGEVNVTSGGPLEFRLNDRAGVDAWIDDRPITTHSETLPADLTGGMHALILRVDTSARMGLPLKVEVVKPEGSSAEFTVVGGR
jgi:hypothetical protein